MKLYRFALPLLLMLTSCVQPLLNPLRDGTIDRRAYTWKKPSDRICITPGQSLEVRACENSKIQDILTGPDSSISVIAKGECVVVYINLRSTLVTKGQRIHKGDLIGELYNKDEVLSNMLFLKVYGPNNKPFHPKYW